MKPYSFSQQDFGAPPPPPPTNYSSTPPPPPPPSGSMGGDKASSRATWALILGIAAWVFCGIFTAIPAWIMGRNEMRDIDAGHAPQSGRTLAQIGMWLGIVNTIIYVLAIIGIGLYFLVIVLILGTSR